MIKNLFDILRRNFLRIWPALYHALVNLLFSLLPLIAVYIVTYIYEGKIMKLAEITGRGEMIIICIPIAVTIIFSLFQISDKYRKSKGGITWPSIVFAITLFTACIGIFIYTQGYKMEDQPNSRLAIYSVAFLGWVFIAMMVNNYYSHIDGNMPRSRDEDEEKLRQKFLKTGD